MVAIFKRELKSYFTSMVGYAAAAALLFYIALMFTANNLLYGMPDFAGVLYGAVVMLLFTLPALTMRSFADERRNKTDQLLLTSPVTIPAIVLGKYFAQVAVFLAPLAVVCVMPLVLTLFGTVSLVSAYSALLAFFLLGAACLAVGTWLSAMTENQIIAYLATFGVLLIAYMMNSIQSLFTAGDTLAFLVFVVVLIAAALLAGTLCKNLLVGGGVFAAGAVLLVALFQMRSAWLVEGFNRVLGAFSLFDPFVDFVGGMFNVTGIVYYLSVIILFLFLTGQTLEKRRWS